MKDKECCNPHIEDDNGKCVVCGRERNIWKLAQPVSEWEKEWDIMIREYSELSDGLGAGHTNLIPHEEKLKLFISNLLTQERAKIREKVEKLAKKHAPINGECDDECELCDGYNQALKEVLAELS